MKSIWRLWAKSLGDKASDNSKDADVVALFRTAIVLLNMITCLVIIFNVYHNW